MKKEEQKEKKLQAEAKLTDEQLKQCNAGLQDYRSQLMAIDRREESYTTATVAKQEGIFNHL